jgi:hypothetical protein
MSAPRLKFDAIQTLLEQQLQHRQGFAKTLVSTFISLNIRLFLVGKRSIPAHRKQPKRVQAADYSVYTQAH